MPDSFITIRASIKNLQPSATLLINEKSMALMAAGHTIYRLGFGQSPFPVPIEVVQSLQKHAHRKDYLPVRGLPALREAVAAFNRRKLGIDCSSDDVMIGPGSKELILGLQMACDADLILPNPSWVSYEPQAHIVQSNVIWVDTSEEEKWLLTAQKLDEACHRQPTGPKLLLLNYPSNPVGTSYSKTQIKALAEVARKHQLLVIDDEIYSELTFSGVHTSLAEYYPEGTIISSGLSKWCGAGGWRLGSFTFPKECRYILDAMATIASESFSAVSAPVQYGAITAFNGSDAIDLYVKNARRILSVVGHYVHQFLTQLDVSMPAPEGGFYLFPNFEKYRSRLEQQGILTSTQLCTYLLDEYGVALLPGSAFGRPETEYTCRLSFVDFDGEKALEVALQLGDQPLDADFVTKYCPNIVGAMEAIVAATFVA